MPSHETLNSLFTDIANAIRGKTGETGSIVADDFPDAIDGIPTAGDSGRPKSISVTDILQGISASHIINHTFNIGSFNDTILINNVITNRTIKTEFADQYTFNRQCIKYDEGVFELRTAYSLDAVSEVVDSGLLTTVSIPLSNFETITSVEVSE